MKKRELKEMIELVSSKLEFITNKFNSAFDKEREASRFVIDCLQEINGKLATLDSRLTALESKPNRTRKKNPVSPADEVNA